jgi:hypothetical protein
VDDDQETVYGGHRGMLESEVETQICESAKKLGWLTYKFVSPSNAGVADRIFFRDGVTLLLEIKRANKKPTALQKKFLRDMRKQKILAYWTDNLIDAEWLLGNFATGLLNFKQLDNRWKLNDDDLKA